MQWQVWNKHPMGYTHKEKFKGEDIIIKAGEFILMDYEEAVQFRCQYFPMKLLGDNTQDPMTFKVIELKPNGKPEEAKPFYVSPVDGKKFETQQELDTYLKENFADREKVVDPELDATIKKGKKL